MFEVYKEKVALLLKVLPLVAKEECFAIHGGTAINLFVRDMPRLSVDIDLTYVFIEDRETTLKKIDETLQRIKSSIEKSIKNSRVTYKDNVGKLLIYLGNADIKIEVNLVNRGLLSEALKMPLCKKAQSNFEAFAVMPVVSIGQLYGGKICAALDRQHPRDLFDIKYLLENEGFSEDIKKGFLFNLLCSDRPINEVIFPNFQDQKQTMDNKFVGMSEDAFSYDDFEATREKLVKTINTNLTDYDKAFLLNFNSLMPDWSVYDFAKFPAIKWKLLNLEKLKNQYLEKYNLQNEALKKALLDK
ncbi:MAG: nucleotidyl transferase AbiEii/AbiGii toxin family protein [Alphaproteobacteria bacterium]